MPVFNAYFMVIKKNIVSIMIYFFIFMALALTFLSLFGAGQPTALFSTTKTNLAFFAEEDSPLVVGLKQSLTKTANIVPVDDDTESIQDALFHQKIAYVLRIPAGFTDDFISGRDEIPLGKTSRPMDPGGVSVDLLVGKYLNLSRLYLQNVPGIEASEVADKVLHDLNKTVNVEMKGSETKNTTTGLAESFRFLPYPILSILLMGITTVMMSFNTTEIQRRNMCAPISPSKMSLQIFLANTVFAAIVWVGLCAISIGLYNKAGFNGSAVLLCLNALVFTVVSAAVAFLAGKFIKSSIVQAAVTNVVTLGVCFLSGVFLEQAFLGETVLKIASFSPGFWYIKAINEIKELTTASFDSLKPIIGYMLIQLAFAAACIIIALVASKQKRQTLESYVL